MAEGEAERPIFMKIRYGVVMMLFFNAIDKKKEREIPCFSVMPSLALGQSKSTRQQGETFSHTLT